jgi:S1-C subfamily serine protease
MSRTGRRIGVAGMTALLLAGCSTRLPTRADLADSSVAYAELAEARAGLAREPLAEYASRRTVWLIDGPNWRLVPQADGTASFHTPGDAASAGLLISGDGYVLTSGHGVASGRPLAILPTSGQETVPRLRPGRVVWHGDAASPAVDLAILKLELAPGDMPLSHVPPRRFGDLPASGSALLMTGIDTTADYPPGHDYSAGRLARYRNAGRQVRHVVAVAPVRPGFSGGPAFDQTGNLAGITSQLAARLHFQRWGLATQFSTLLVRPEAALVERIITQDRARTQAREAADGGT